MDKMKFQFLLTVLVAFLFTAPAMAQDPIVAETRGPNAIIEADKSEVAIGDPIQLKITLPISGEYESLEVELPEGQERQIILGEIQQNGPRQFTIPARIIHGGETTIGPLSLKAYPTGAKAQAEEQDLEQVRSIPLTAPAMTFFVAQPEGEVSAELKDYSPPKDVPFDYFWRNIVFIGIAVAALILLVVLLLILMKIMAKQQRKRRMKPPVPPVDTALNTVRSLKDLHVFQESGAERHYTVLSNAIRGYFEHQFHVSALEMSEDEVMEFIYGDLSHLQNADSLVSVLQRSSAAKFAREELNSDTAKGDCEIAEGFLELEKHRIEEERRRAELLAQQERERHKHAAEAAAKAEADKDNNDEVNKAA